MKAERLNEILDQIEQDLGISERIKIELKPMKIKAASISFKSKTLRINKNMLKDLDEDCIRYLILHELIHYKLKSTYHSDRFYRQLDEKISRSEARELEGKILRSLLELNNIL